MGAVGRGGGARGARRRVCERRADADAAAISARQAALEQARAERARNFVQETAGGAAAAAPAPAAAPAAAGQPSLNDLHMNLYRRAMADAPDHRLMSEPCRSGGSLGAAPPVARRGSRRRMAAADWEAALGDEEGTARRRGREREGPSEGALQGWSARTKRRPPLARRTLGRRRRRGAGWWRPAARRPAVVAAWSRRPPTTSTICSNDCRARTGAARLRGDGDPDNEQHEEQRQSQREQRLTGWLERRRSGAPYVTADGIADPIADRSLDGGEPSLEDSAAAAVRELPESLVQRHRDAGAAFPLLTSIREVMDYEAMMERGETSHDDAVASIVARRRQPPPPAGPSEELDRRILARAALANMEEAETLASGCAGPSNAARAATAVSCDWPTPT